MKFLSELFLKGILTFVLLISVFPTHAQTAGNALPTQPGYYRMPLGDYQVIALSDGTLPLNMKALLHEKHPGEVRTLLQRSYLDTIVETSITGYLILAGDQQILVDAGSGTLFGPTLGKLKSNLVAAGFRPEDIDAVLLTHLHSDHVGGLTDNGKMAFPNATITSANRKRIFG